MDDNNSYKYLFVGTFIALIFSIAAGIYFYSQLNNRIDQLTSEKTALEIDLNKLENENKTFSENLIATEIKLEFKQKEVERLESEVLNKLREIESKEKEIIELERKNERYLDRINQYMTTGGTKEIKEHIEKLNAEIKRTRKQRDSIRVERNKLVTDLNNLIKVVDEKEEKIEVLTKSTIPSLENRIYTLNQELEHKKNVERFYNLRAEIEGLELDQNSNSIIFTLNFTEEEVQLMKSLNLNSVTLFPSVKNMNTQQYWELTTRGSFGEMFKINKNDLSTSMHLGYKVNNISLRKAFKKKNAINLQKGTPFMIDVRIEELNNLSIAQSKFKIKTR